MLDDVATEIEKARDDLAAVLVLADELLAQVARMKVHADTVSRRLDRLERSVARVQAAESTATSSEPESAAANGDTKPEVEPTMMDPAHLVAMELAAMGTSREEVHAYLSERFGLADHSQILDDVFPSR